MRSSVFLLSLGMACFLCPHGGKTETWEPLLQSSSLPWTTPPHTPGDNTPPETSDSILKSLYISSSSYCPICNGSTQTTIIYRLTRIGKELTTTETRMMRNGLKNSESVFSKNSSDNSSHADNRSYFENMNWATNASEFQNGSVGLSGNIIDYISVPFFGFCCIFGNTINIFVMLFSPLRHMSNTKILVCLAISDSTFILLFPFNKRFFRELLGIDIRSLSKVSCQIFFFFFRTSKMSSAWFVTLISIERFVAIWLPLKAKIINSQTTIRREILLVVFVLSSVNLSWSMVGTGLQNGTCVPHASIEGYPNMKKEFVVYGITFVFMLPTLIMLVLCPMTVFRLFLNYRSRMHMTNSVHDTGRNKSTNDTIRATIMLLSVTVAFVVLTAPITFGHIYTVFTDQDIFESMEGDMNIFRNIAQIMELMNFSINFFLYFGISKSYRSYLISSCRFRKKNVGCKSISKTESTTTA